MADEGVEFGTDPSSSQSQHVGGENEESTVLESDENRCVGAEETMIDKVKATLGDEVETSSQNLAISECQFIEKDASLKDESDSDEVEVDHPDPYTQCMHYL